MDKKEENEIDGIQIIPEKTDFKPWFNPKFSKEKLKANQDFRNDRRSKDDR